MYPTRLSLPQEKHYEVGFLFDRFCYSSGLFYGEQRGTNEYFSATNVKDLHPAKEYFMRQFKREFYSTRNIQFSPPYFFRKMVHKRAIPFFLCVIGEARASSIT